MAATNFAPATAPVTHTCWSQLNEISSCSVELNLFERSWETCASLPYPSMHVRYIINSASPLTLNATTGYAYMRNDVLATGLLAIILHKVVFFALSAFWMTVDSRRWFSRYKVQRVRIVCLETFLEGNKDGFG